MSKRIALIYATPIAKNAAMPVLKPNEAMFEEARRAPSPSSKATADKLRQRFL